MSTIQIKRAEITTASIVACKAYKKLWELQKQVTHPLDLGQFLMLRRINNRDDFELVHLFEGESYGYRFKMYETEEELLSKGLFELYTVALAMEKASAQSEMFDPAGYRHLVNE